MKNRPLLSIIVPVYNTEAYLTRCVDSLLQQKYQNIEILLIDDGSADASPAICDRYAQTHANVRVLHKINEGLGEARNSGLELVTGDYVTFLDSDDYIHEDMYVTMLKHICEEGAEAAFCDFSFVRRDGRIEQRECTISPGKYPARDILLEMLGSRPEARYDFGFDMSVCKGIFDMSIIRRQGLRFPSERSVLCEDIFFNLEFLRHAGHVVYLAQGWYFYCENAGSLTHRYIPERLRKEKELFCLLQETAQDVLTDHEVLRLHRLFLGRIRSAITQYVIYKDRYTFPERIQNIRMISNDDLVRQIIQHYPIRKNPLKLRIFNSLLKWKFCIGMYFIIALNR